MKKGFIDTNIASALVFILNSLHLKSEEIIKIYSELYWSKFVKQEFLKRYIEKYSNLRKFYQDLKIHLENPTKELYSSSDLKKK